MSESLRQPVALLLDLDGVVADSEPLHEEAIYQVFDEVRIEVPDTFVDTIKGRTDLDVMEQVASMYRGPGRLDPVDLVVRKMAIYRELMPEITPISGALEFIRWAHERYRLALTTSSDRESQQFIFEAFALSPFFETVVTAEDIRLPKPDPEPYHVTASRLSLEPEACLVIEDSVNGILSGRGAGCQVAGLTTSFPASELLRAGCNRAVASFAELQHVLENAESRSGESTGRF